jgi:hypothetical protein
LVEQGAGADDEPVEIGVGEVDVGTLLDLDVVLEAPSSVLGRSASGKTDTSTNRDTPPPGSAPLWQKK